MATGYILDCCKNVGTHKLTKHNRRETQLLVTPILRISIIFYVFTTQNIHENQGTDSKRGEKILAIKLFNLNPLKVLY